MTETFKLLLVEDSDEDAELVLRVVKKIKPDLSFKRVQTEDEMKAACADDSWDLILSDYNLPKFSGLEAIRVLKESKADAPLILVSGTIGEETAVEALKTGASDYVLKSNLGRLSTAIEHTLRAKKAEMKNRRLLKQLEQAQKMEAVGRLAGGVAHDVNNALAAITIYAETALEQIRMGEASAAKECLEGILTSQQSAAGIVRQLLSFSRKNLGPNEVIDFSIALERVRPLVKTLLGERIEFDLELPQSPMYVVADPIQIEQIIMNLAVNARDAMPSGGRFRISVNAVQVKAPPLDARLPVSSGQYACLSARDTGTGIPPEILEKIFEPFFTTKELGKGTGLGLPVIYGIVKQAKGTIVVESRLGVGTEFKVLWPIVNPKTETKVRPPASLHSVPHVESSGTILLVEDEDSLRRPLAAILRKSGFEIIEASNGVEAMTIITDKKLSVRLLVTDMVMPRMNGLELAKQVRAQSPNARILYLSGYSDQDIDDGKVDTSASWFLQKPFTSKAFTEKISEVLAASQRKDS